MRICARRSFFTLLVLCVFFVPAILSAAPASDRGLASVEGTGDGLLAWVRSVLSLFWGEKGSAQPESLARTDNGPGLDPSGHS
jgi:hypothetical protein